MKAKNKLVQVEILVGDEIESATRDRVKNDLHSKALDLAYPVDGLVESRIRDGNLLQVEIVLGPRIDEPTAQGIQAQLRREASQLAKPVDGKVVSRIAVEES